MREQDAEVQSTENSAENGKREVIVMLSTNNKGQSMVEYILIVALIAVIVIAGVRIFGDQINSLFQDSSQKIESETNR